MQFQKTWRSFDRTIREPRWYASRYPTSSRSPIEVQSNGCTRSIYFAAQDWRLDAGVGEDVTAEHAPDGVFVVAVTWER